ncbi:M23 family metallopeptidase [Porphyromonadaceae bacterium W3.11]|nr:M23 family metallopeptidase [Porphyromonadaceae bacterium W3.11]
MVTRLASLLFAGVLSVGMVSAQTVQVQKETSKTVGGKNPVGGVTDIVTQKGDSIPEIAQLFADNVNLKDSKKISNFATAINESLGCDEVSEEDLMYPAVDLYGENSWRTDCVNPFVRGAVANIPDSFSINLSQFSYPLDEVQRITSRYGYRPRFRRMHYGIDVKVQVGDTIRAAFDGKVRMVKYDRRGYGKYVVIRHVNGLETIYAHCSKHLVKNDQIVRAGEPIALGGNTGRSTGSHLHFEARFLGQPINPEHLINFNTGIPLNENYLFVKNGRSNRSNRNATYAKRSGTPNGNGVVVHKIRKGDTLSGIASRYGTSVSHLCKVNGISRRSTLRVGRTLRVNG